MSVITPDDVCDAVKELTGYNPRDFCRERQFVHARKLAIWGLKEICDMSLQDIVNVIGYADDGSVRYHLKSPPNFKELSMVIQTLSEELYDR
jgi:chromosomal replication initiation ATPase DnaA